MRTIQLLCPMIKELSAEDCKKCIGYLLDKFEDENTRVAAAESLMYCIGQAPKDALFKVLMDDSEPDYMREEAAGSLGTLWAESEIEYERLSKSSHHFWTRFYVTLICII
ncbi:hypothetical protein [Shewanella algae]|uniref:hypothetical protein n=1 Tax=Shewanella algae TaxID=38313 RepID=UPI00313C949F